MKKCKRISACLLAVLCLLCALAMPAGAEGFEYGWDQDSNNPNGPHCKAYFMLNLDTHTAVYSNNADEQLPMASLTKIMSYIVAYETIPDIENAQITIPQSVVDELAGTGSSVAEFNVGETFTGLDLLYLMMVPSGNNAALTLAKYVDQLYAEGKLNGTSTSGTVSATARVLPAQTAPVPPPVGAPPARGPRMTPRPPPLPSPLWTPPPWPRPMARRASTAATTPAAATSSS